MNVSPCKYPRRQCTCCVVTLPVSVCVCVWSLPRPPSIVSLSQQSDSRSVEKTPIFVHIISSKNAHTPQCVHVRVCVCMCDGCSVLIPPARYTLIHSQSARLSCTCAASPVSPSHTHIHTQYAQYTHVPLGLDTWSHRHFGYISP